MLQHLPAHSQSEDIATVLATDGACVVDDLASSDLMDRVMAEMQPFIDATPNGVDSFAGFTTKRTGALVARSVASREMVMHPTVRGVVGKVLAHATNHQLHLTQTIAIGPGSPAQPIHRDQWAFDLFPFPLGYEVQCNTIWAATDFTEANGATRVVLGSNLREDRLKFELADSVAAEMTRGSVLFYTGAVYHAGGANLSDHTRVGVNISYNVAWLRQEENQYLSVPREVAAELDEDLQRLLGYAKGAYALGYVDDVRDPIAVLRPGVDVEVGFGPPI